MEYRDLYDEQGILTGETILKGEECPLNRRLLVAALIIENDENKLLIQKRSNSKKGKWAFTSGHIESKENIDDGILREAKEELGLTLKKENIIKIKSGINEKYVYEHFYIKKNIKEDKLKLQPEEVDEVKWLNSKEIKKLIEKGLFETSHINIFENYINYFEKDYEAS